MKRRVSSRILALPSSPRVGLVWQGMGSDGSFLGWPRSRPRPRPSPRPFPLASYFMGHGLHLQSAPQQQDAVLHWHSLPPGGGGTTQR